MALPTNDKIIGDLGHTADHNAIVDEITYIKQNYYSASSGNLNFTDYLRLDTASNVYAPRFSASFSGIPTAPTASAGTNTQQIATTGFVRSEITNLIASAPATLDTLNELAAALGNDPNFATSTASAIGQRLLVSTASSIYLSQSDAKTLYPPISSSSNFLTTANASATYATKNSPVFSGSVTASQFIGKIEYSNILNPPTGGTASISWINVTDKPSPIVGVNLIGSVTGAASVTLTNLTNGQITINTSGGGGGSASTVDWSNVTNKPDPIIGINLIGSVTGAASATLTSLSNAQISINTEQNILINQQTTASYTLQLSDSGKLITMNNLNGNLIIIPSESSINFPVGSKIDITQVGSGTSSISFNSGVVLNSDDNKRIISNRYAAATLIKLETDSWILIGALQ